MGRPAKVEAAMVNVRPSLDDNEGMLLLLL